MRVMAVACVVAACGGGGSTSGPKVPTASTAAEVLGSPTDALWALAPAGATTGLVISPRAVGMADHAIADLRKVWGDRFDELLAKLPAKLQGKWSTLADLGLAVDSGLAGFSVGDEHLLVLPVADRAKFAAAWGGTSSHDVDAFGRFRCKPLGNLYACATNDVVLASVGKGALREHVLKVGTRGDIEVVMAFPTTDGRLSSVVATAELSRGAVTVRALITPTQKRDLGPVAKVRADRDHSVAFAVFDLGGGLRKWALASSDVPFGEVAPTIAGPLTLDMPGDKSLDVRVPLTDPKPFAELLAHCAGYSSLRNAGVHVENGVCKVPIGAGEYAEGRVENNELRIATKPLANRPGLPWSPVAAEIARGSWYAAVWARGTPSYVPPWALGFDPAVDQYLGYALWFVHEFGFAAGPDPNGMRVIASVRTLWANPDDLVERLVINDPSKFAGDIGKQIAETAPTSPFALDRKAGGDGLAFAHAILWMIRDKPAEHTAQASTAESAPIATVTTAGPPANLAEIKRRLELYFHVHGKFPVGHVPVPKKSCCAERGRMCRATWSEAPWQAMSYHLATPSPYRFGYDSDGKTADVTAVGDLDCDAQQATYKLHADGSSGKAVFTTSEPPAGVR